ncbi:hypothetical protein A3Q56_01532 [Intoshia linei]|uniref:Phosphatidylinositol 4-kinase type 2 n=1 Tax=Intoshia linei TaxID=1819745 RepID=A0A177B8W7_9BILA|nr:hypothetical protein A3Q56_01532 [Intoshia linei]
MDNSIENYSIHSDNLPEVKVSILKNQKSSSQSVSSDPTKFQQKKEPINKNQLSKSMSHNEEVHKSELTPLLDKQLTQDEQSTACMFYKDNKTFDGISNDKFYSLLKNVRRAIEQNILPEIVYQGSSGSYFVKNLEKTNLKSVCFPYNADTQKIFNEARIAINQNILPILSLKGSSGSYLVRNHKNQIIGIFKPKDEEPYGSLNPKWIKWIQKKCCPCCFGRSCLTPNQGFLSEVGASLVDSKLDLGIVPLTRCVRLSSKTFNYSAIDRAKSRTKKNIAERLPDIAQRFHRIGLPAKTGSLQTFVYDYEDADCVLRRLDDEKTPIHIKKKFRAQFERLVILDYIIRNTDRSNSNWLIKYKPSNIVGDASVDEGTKLQEKTDDSSNIKEKIKSDTSSHKSVESDESDKYRNYLVADEGDIAIAAIDNGLAFPYKHPNEWRAYPYHWAWLKCSLEPFSEDTCNKFLPLLNDDNFVQSIVDDLAEIFKIDSNFDEKIFFKQMSVMRGQIKNLVKALEDRKSPYELTQLALIVIEKTKNKNENLFTQRFNMRNPFFSWC